MLMRVFMTHAFDYFCFIFDLVVIVCDVLHIVFELLAYVCNCFSVTVTKLALKGVA